MLCSLSCSLLSSRQPSLAPGCPLLLSRRSRSPLLTAAGRLRAGVALCCAAEPSEGLEEVCRSLVCTCWEQGCTVAVTQLPLQVGQRIRKLGGNSSEYIGVCFDTASQRWIAQFYLNQTHMHLGLFKSEIEAARARDQEARRQHELVGCAHTPSTQACTVHLPSNQDSNLSTCSFHLQVLWQAPAQLPHS